MIKPLDYDSGGVKRRANPKSYAVVACFFPVVTFSVWALSAWMIARFDATIPAGQDYDDFGYPVNAYLMQAAGGLLLLLGAIIGLTARVLGERRFSWVALLLNILSITGAMYLGR